MNAPIWEHNLCMYLSIRPRRKLKLIFPFTKSKSKIQFENRNLTLTIGFDYDIIQFVLKKKGWQTEMKLKIVAGILISASYIAALGYGIGIKNQNSESQMEKANPNPELTITCMSLNSIMNSPNPNLKMADEIQNEIDNLESESEGKIETENSIPFFYITDEDRQIIHGIVAGESKGESIRGKKLVAQCIMNAMIRNDWDAKTVRTEYKYAGWEPELEKSNPELWAEVVEAVADVFDNGNLETYEPILYFYAPKYVYSHWHENELTYVLTEGGHKFFKLPGE